MSDNINTRKEMFTKGNLRNLKENFNTTNLYTALYDTFVNIPALYLLPYINGNFDEPILTDTVEIKEIAKFGDNEEYSDKLITVSDVEKEFVLRIENDKDDIRISLYDFDSNNKEKYLSYINKDTKTEQNKLFSKKGTLLNIDFTKNKETGSFELNNYYINNNRVQDIVKAISMLNLTYKVDDSVSLSFKNNPFVNIEPLIINNDYSSISHKNLMDFEQKFFDYFNNKIKNYYIENMIDIFSKHASFIEEQIFNKELSIIDKVLGKSKPRLNEYFYVNSLIPYYENCPIPLIFKKKSDSLELSINKEILLEISSKDKSNFILSSLEIKEPLLLGHLKNNNKPMTMYHQKNINLLSNNLFSIINTLSPDFKNEYNIKTSENKDLHLEYD